MKIKSNMFFLIIFLIFSLMHTVVIFWFFQNTPMLTLNTFAKLLPFLFSAVYIALYALSKKLNYWPLESVLLTYLGALFLAFCLVSLIILLASLLKIFHVTLPNTLGLWVLGTWIIITVISLYTAAKTPNITDITFAAPNLKQDVKIAFIADTHFGATVGVKRAKNLKQIIETNKPDLIVFAGDVFETNFKDSLPFAQVLADILPDKKYGVLGNHEYYQGLDDERQSFKAAGITLLENKSEIFEDINIIGINDIKTSGISVQEFISILQKEIKPNSFNLLLSHTPLYFKEASQAGVNLMLSGHTHKGQIWPFSFLVKLAFPYFNGKYQEGDANLYVTSGTFFWGPPLRFLTNNEIVFITLKGTK